MSNGSKIVVYIPKEWQSIAVNDSGEMASVVPGLSSPPASSSAAGSGAAGAGLPGKSRRPIFSRLHRGCMAVLNTQSRRLILAGCMEACMVAPYILLKIRRIGIICSLHTAD